MVIRWLSDASANGAREAFLFFPAKTESTTTGFSIEYEAGCNINGIDNFGKGHPVYTLNSNISYHENAVQKLWQSTGGNDG